MPEYWQFPTVSMGLGPIMAIYQAHIMKYLEQRGLLPNEPKEKYGCFVVMEKWMSQNLLVQFL